MSSSCSPSSIEALLGGRQTAAKSKLLQMFHLLCDNPYGLHTKELMDRLYADDPDGGPENNSVVGVMVWRFNKMARQNRLGLEIHTRAGYKRALNGGRYCIWVVRH